MSGHAEVQVLYTRLQCEQPGIQAHLDELLSTYPSAEVENELAAADTLFAAPDGLVSAIPSLGILPDTDDAHPDNQQGGSMDTSEE
eukprot:m.672606 g.672606  ORF g.672606 m.672606 type:complete len:86 (-) comp22776_c1_seq61:2618-2875(-)